MKFLIRFSTSFFYFILINNLQSSSSIVDIPHDDYMDKNNELPLKFDDIVDSKTYDKMRPPKPGGKHTVVEFHVTVMSLDSINEGSMTYAADIFFAQEWMDPRLHLPENMTREYTILPIEWLQDIWRPDSFFKNAKKVTFQIMTIPNHYVWLFKNKHILYMVKLTLLLSCAMKFESYPHDEQICMMSMESLSHTTDDLVFQWLPLEKTPLVVENIELPQLELTSNYTGDCTTVYSTGNFTCLEVVFKFRRRLGYYLFHTYIPTCLIVVMSWISFWIKPEAVPARVTLGVTSLLTLSTQHATSQKSLPPVSYIKAIDIFMSSCTVFVFLSLIEYAFVNVMMGDISEIERKDQKKTMRRQERIDRQASIFYPNNREDNEVHYMAMEGGTVISPSDQLHTHPAHPATHPTTHPTHPTTHLNHPTPDKPHVHPPENAHIHHSHTHLPPPAPTPPLRHNSLAEVASAAAAAAAAAASAGCPKHGNGSTQMNNRRNNAGTATSATNSLKQLLSMDNPLLSSVKKQQIHKKFDPKDIMKKRRERAICIDRVSRIIFPSTFILLNIIYWLTYSNILQSIGAGGGN